MKKISILLFITSIFFFSASTYAISPFTPASANGDIQRITFNAATAFSATDGNLQYHFSSVNLYSNSACSTSVGTGTNPSADEWTETGIALPTSITNNIGTLGLSSETLETVATIAGHTPKNDDCAVYNIQYRTTGNGNITINSDANITCVLNASGGVYTGCKSSGSTLTINLSRSTPP